MSTFFCSIIVLVVLGIVLDYFWTTLFRRVRKGKFKVVSDFEGAFQFETNFGQFRIDHKTQRMSVVSKQKRVSFSLKDISALRYTYNDEWALFNEWLFGFDYTDLLTNYQDLIHWYTITIKTNDGQKIPVFVAGQWEPREFLFGWYIQLQENILSRFGLFREIDEHCSEVFEQIHYQLKKSGIEIPLR